MNDDLRKELDELDNPSAEGEASQEEAVEPAEAEPPVEKVGDSGVVTEEVGETADVKLEKALRQIDNLNRAISEERAKRRDYISELALLKAQFPAQTQAYSPVAEQTESEVGVDSDATEIVRKVIKPELDNVLNEIKRARFERSEEKARAKYSDYDKVVQEYFVPMIDADPALEETFKRSDDPAEFAYSLAVASNIKNIIEQVRKEATEAERKRLVDELKGKDRKITSLSNVGGVNMSASRESSLRKELDELY